MKLFDPEGDGYDYETAKASGIVPDETGHWASRDPTTGLILKGIKHPTFEKTIQGEKDAGYEIVKKGDRYYSFPKKEKKQRNPFFLLGLNDMGEEPAYPLPVQKPVPARPTYVMEPDLLEAQGGQQFPPGLMQDDAGRFFYQDKPNEFLPVVKRPGMVPVAKTPEGYTFAMPKVLDIVGNMGGGWAAPSGGVTLGAGMVKSGKAAMNDKYKIEKSFGVNDEPIYKVMDGDKAIAEARLSHTGEYVVDLGVKKDYRRQGIATDLYNHIENDLGRKLKPSPVHQTEEGKAFWASRNKPKLTPVEGNPFAMEWNVKGFEDAQWYHGTTHDFDKFKLAKGNPENHLGKYPHFTSSPEDAAKNYAGHGPDLTGRIERRAEELMPKNVPPYGTLDYDRAYSEAIEKATKELAGPHDGAIIPAKMKLDNPVS
jgi:GNAT superfamily N-acetyltransferase